MFDELDVSKAAGLRKAVHSGLNFDKDAVVVDEGGELILVHDVVWNCPGGDP